MSPQQRREAAHRVSVAGNTVAGTAGAGFGAAKIRDAFKDEHEAAFNRGIAHAGNVALKQGVHPAKVVRMVRAARSGHPGFNHLVVGTTAGAVAAGAHRYSQHLDRKVAKSAFGVEHEVEKSLRERARQAKNPPEVKTKAVTSSAIRSLGYQKQSRRLAVEMHSRPGEPYVYRVSPSTAKAMDESDSKGKFYTSNIRHQAPRAKKVRARDRARLFAQPVSKSVSAFGVNHGAA